MIFLKAMFTHYSLDNKANTFGWVLDKYMTEQPVVSFIALLLPDGLRAHLGLILHVDIQLVNVHTKHVVKKLCNRINKLLI